MVDFLVGEHPNHRRRSKRERRAKCEFSRHFCPVPRPGATSVTTLLRSTSEIADPLSNAAD
jgi:hypothetical protein